MSVALCAIGGAPIASPTGADESATNGKTPPKRRSLARPDAVLAPEAR